MEQGKKTYARPKSGFGLVVAKTSLVTLTFGLTSGGCAALAGSDPEVLTSLNIAPASPAASERPFDLPTPTSPPRTLTPAPTQTQRRAEPGPKATPAPPTATPRAAPQPPTPTARPALPTPAPRPLTRSRSSR